MVTNELADECDRQELLGLVKPRMVANISVHGLVQEHVNQLVLEADRRRGKSIADVGTEYTDSLLERQIRAIEAAVARATKENLGRGVYVETWLDGAFSVTLSRKVPAKTVAYRHHTTAL